MTFWQFIADLAVAISSLIALVGLARKYQPYLAS